MLVDFIGDAVRSAEQTGAEALVIQLDSTGTVVPQRTIDALAFRLGHASVPIGVWVGQSGARAYEGAFQLATSAPVAGVAPGTRLGNAPAPVFGGSNPLANRTVTGQEAEEQGLVDFDAPTLGIFVLELDGREVAGRRLDTADVTEQAGQNPRRDPNVQVRFGQLNLTARLLHTVASPSLAYLLLAVGLLLLVFEFYTAGFGVAAVVGAGSLALSAYGLGVLPTRWWAVALIALGVLGYVIDLQAGAPRVWTVVGTLALALGSFALFDGLSVSLLTLVVVIVGVALFMVSAMPSVIRARFSTQTIGRTSMIGEMGTALASVDPDGTVEVRGAPWRARTNRATPIGAGDLVRVVGIDGLLLEVEPEAGGARDAGH